MKVSLRDEKNFHLKITHFPSIYARNKTFYYYFPKENTIILNSQFSIAY